MISGLHHVQLAMPSDGEAEAEAFYAGLLGIPRVAKTAHLETRGGCWFEDENVRIHLGVETEFRPARKAHPAFSVNDLATLRNVLEDLQARSQLRQQASLIPVVDRRLCTAHENQPAITGR